MLLTLMIAVHCELIILVIGLSRISKYRLQLLRTLYLSLFERTAFENLRV
jgi:hypothetical protein